jgi:PBSX family phage terminase large subunit
MNDHIELTKKQAEYISKANHRWNFAVGAVRSGKSFMGVQYIIPQCILERKGKKGVNLILAATKENIERNVLTPMRDIWGSKLVSDINSRNWSTIFGEKAYCLGAENIRQVSKLRGSEIKFAYVDEIVDMNEKVFDMLKSRLSLPYSVCHAAANPAGPNHFVKKFIDSAEKGVDVYSQRYLLEDNPFLPENYVRDLKLEYAGTVYYDRFILGLWTQAEGLIYPMFKEAISLPSVDTPEQYVLSIDYGTQNAFAGLLWAKRGTTWYAEREYYYSGRDKGVMKTDEEYANDLDKFVSDVPGTVTTIVDPSAASFIALLYKKEKYHVRKANNDVANGIRDTATCMKLGKIKISPDLKNWRKEVEGYVWDDKQGEDKPVKENDHLMDAMRYFVKTMDLAKREVPYKSPFGG